MPDLPRFTIYPANINVLALRTDAVPHSNAFTKRSLMLHRRHRALNGRDHSLIRRENVGEKYSDFCDDRNLNKFQWQKKGMGAQLKLE
ncbi:hypothetical protein NUU61_008576 [Penicillium alfredii]|uniref:Uncharacterized protein n=1 Tax=Penicillium alfredii TaxID=1506179 RepID=A0A9W9ELE5_9EURO|nr:uncharacterized protein NUU61_008576 [Penicillium alfredii]KAJ5083997.1 hypothetical protein NUU61_008576 [Penicillium alfredii]